MKPLRLAVVGDPVAHSASPNIFARLFAARGIDGTYEAIRIVAGDGAARFAALRDAGYDGLNVTTPLKDEAFAASEAHDAVARASRAVNVLAFGESIRGFNTDGVGAVAALRAAGMTNVIGKRTLVLGAGPTARAAVVALAIDGSHVAVWNRTEQKIVEMAASFGVARFDRALRYDAVFSTLPPAVGPHDLDPNVVSALGRAMVVVDANYGERATLAHTFDRPDAHDGRAMLEASAQAAFELFTTAMRS